MPEDHERVYVLRLWDEGGPPHGHRISLYDATTGERLYFGTLEALLDYLNAQLEGSETASTPHMRS